VGFLFASLARAENAPRWIPGPELVLGAKGHTVVLAGGRLLTCFPVESDFRCELVDPVTGARQVAPFKQEPSWLAKVTPLSDGHLLSVSETAASLIDPVSGTTTHLATPVNLYSFRAKPLSFGRALFLRGPDCSRLVFFEAKSRAFRQVVAAPPGTCVQDVFDLGDERLLLARTIRSARANDIDFVILKLADFSWQRGARVPWREAYAAFRHGSNIAVMLHDTSHQTREGYRGEVLYLDDAAQNPRPMSLPRSGLALDARRLGDHELVFFNRLGVLSWNFWSEMVALPLPAAERDPRFVLERDGALVALDFHARRALVLTRNPPAPDTPCDDLFHYVESVLARAESRPLDHEMIDALLPGRAGLECRRYLERQRRFPAFLQEPLDALLERTSGSATPQEEIAAQWSCTLLPAWSERPIRRILERNRLNRIGFAASACRHAPEILPVAVAALGPTKPAGELVHWGVRSAQAGSEVRPWVVPLLASRPDLVPHAGPLLRAAKERRATGFGTLRTFLCEPAPRSGLSQDCGAVSGVRERDFSRGDERARVLLNFGIATGVIGGLGTLAYAARDDDLGRGLAAATCTVPGMVLGGSLAFAVAGGHGDTSGLGAILLAVPLGIAGGVLGGWAGYALSEEPGSRRFATSAVPLSAAWVTGAVLTLDAW
jgi:hypothetical protein